jgi:methyl-accepting chemotaxis protein
MADALLVTGLLVLFVLGRLSRRLDQIMRILQGTTQSVSGTREDLAACSSRLFAAVREQVTTVENAAASGQQINAMTQSHQKDTDGARQIITTISDRAFDADKMLETLTASSDAIVACSGRAQGALRIYQRCCVSNESARVERRHRSRKGG